MESGPGPTDVGLTMPARPRRIGATVYVDQSHLSEAFKARSGLRTSAGFRELAECVEHVAHRANLVFSLVHVLELSRWDDDRMRQGMCDWLDGLELVWARSKDAVEHDEEERCLKLCAGLATPPVNAFAPSLLSSLDDITVSDVPSALRGASVRSFVEVARTAPQTPWQEALVTNLVHMRNDGQLADDLRLSDKARADILRENRRRDLVERAHAAHQRLSADPAYVALKPDPEEISATFARRVAGDDTLLRSNTIVGDHVRALLAVGVARSAGSRGERRLLSAPLDAMHAAVGGAYCDIFTCDHETDRWLGSARERLGLERQLTDVDAIVGRLRLL